MRLYPSLLASLLLIGSTKMYATAVDSQQSEFTLDGYSGKFYQQTSASAQTSHQLKVQSRSPLQHRFNFSAAEFASFLKFSVVTPFYADRHQSYRVRESHVASCDDLQFSEGPTHAAAAIHFKGEARGDGCELSFQMSLETVATGLHLRVAVTSLDYSKREPNAMRFLGYTRLPETLKIAIDIDSPEQEAIYGGGAQVSHFDLKGQKLPMLVQEQGIGRGKAGLSQILALVARGAQGSSVNSYAPVPGIVTSQGRGFLLHGYDYKELDFSDRTRMRLSTYGTTLDLSLLDGTSFADTVTRLTEHTGRMRPLPDWSHRGLVLGMQGGEVDHDRRTGGQFAVLRKVKELQTAGAPVAAVWLQDWVGKRRNWLGSFLWWDWQVDRNSYPDWEQMVQTLDQEHGVKTLSYINPFLAKRNRGDSNPSLFDEAIAENALLELDGSGIPYLLKVIVFQAGLINLFSENARTWLQSIIDENILQAGVKGYMADFGESYPIYSHASRAAAPIAAHNRYPVLWSQLHQKVSQRTDSDDLLYFSRSAFTQSPKYNRLFWLGDQTTTWDQKDGLRSALLGLLSSGVSGQTLNHSDIGGYAAIVPLGIKRRKELFLRWVELNSFSAFFRTHEGNSPQGNHQYDSDAESFQHFIKFSRLFAALFDYRKSLMLEASTYGWPLVRPLIFHGEFNSDVSQNWEQFYFGKDLLVAPMLSRSLAIGRSPQVQVILPRGQWRHLWSGQLYSAATDQQISVAAPVGNPAVFMREDSENPALASFRAYLQHNFWSDLNVLQHGEP